MNASNIPAALQELSTGGSERLKLKHNLNAHVIGRELRVRNEARVGAVQELDHFKLVCVIDQVVQRRLEVRFAVRVGWHRLLSC